MAIVSFVPSLPFTRWQLVNKNAKVLHTGMTKYTQNLDLGYCNSGDKVIVVCAEKGDDVIGTGLSMRIVTVQ